MGAVPISSTKMSFKMDEVILWEYRKKLVKWICINNYSPLHARLILMGLK
tara:strand:- start:57 stop:206 length:150 start_codon:yes stop_codon:yes gene_type:complete